MFLRAVVVARILTILSAASGPFYFGSATGRLGLSSSVAVTVLFAMQPLGAVSGGLAYSWLGARRPQLYIRLALAGAAFLPVSVLPASVAGAWPLYLGFLVFGLSFTGLFDSHQNWVITFAPAGQRPIYAGLFNTVASAMPLAAPLIGDTAAPVIGYEPLFAVSLLMALGALLIALRHMPQPVSVVGGQACGYS